MKTRKQIRKQRLKYFQSEIIPKINQGLIIKEYPSFIKLKSNLNTNINYDYYPMGERLCINSPNNRRWIDLSINNFIDKFNFYLK